MSEESTTADLVELVRRLAEAASERDFDTADSYYARDAVADDYLELAGERVLVSFHLTGHGKASGIDIARVHTNGATLFVIGDAKVGRVVQYLDRDRALADLGLAG